MPYNVLHVQQNDVVDFYLKNYLIDIHLMIVHGLQNTQLSFTNFSFVIEGTSWGEILLLFNASYLQGLMEEFDGDISGTGDPTCGQAITVTYMEQLRETSVEEPPNPLPPSIGGGNYSFGNSTWEGTWVFRRVNTSASDSKTIPVNDITIQSWSLGDDYEGEFFYLSPSETEHQHDTNQ